MRLKNLLVRRKKITFYDFSFALLYELTIYYFIRSQELLF